MARTYAGARLRRLREERRLSQAELARTLGISPSYLNQMEHDARPLTVPVLLKIGETFGIDASFFSARDATRLLADLREALAAPLDEGRVLPGELEEIATRTPGAARLLLDLQRRSQRLTEQLSGRGGGPEDERESPGSPHEEVRDFFYERRNYFHPLDLAAEDLAGELRVRPGTAGQTLAEHLEAQHGVHVATTAGPHAHRYDTATRTLHLSPRLRPGQQTFRMAAQLALLEYGSELDSLAAEKFPRQSPAHALTRIGLAHYFAGALVLPYREFHARAEEYRYDIERLGDHYGLGYETMCHRLSTLQRPRLSGVPLSFVRVDRAGNMSKRQSATGFPFSRSGGTCPLWNIYEAFTAPGRVHVQLTRMPDGSRHLWTARTVTRRGGAWGERGSTYAIGLGCEVRHAGRLVYSEGLDLDSPASDTPIGMGCRVCEHLDCPQRATPPVGHPLAIDQHTSTFVPYQVRSDPAEE
ncbi:short-chain fatty acyl-CoA regulator family protein [Streptomyces evansiae]|uniref:short-chain fatty acyl-CoA regulator family protein n=1 Tax=Streptomyces evansiae TaxID=3075535 RepID=UPI0028886C4C|nr:short-chain fatty acyl-CoA regulator family protein [Streptomyces sp. DSM 41859]MDT0423964.1 short-chain fatty acyl-CoA regulator family protein [Streptomyces sp. DSM 41859]